MSENIKLFLKNIEYLISGVFEGKRWEELSGLLFLLTFFF